MFHGLIEKKDLKKMTKENHEDFIRRFVDPEPRRIAVSRGGLMVYSCPNCASSNIQPVRVIGQGPSGECLDCNTWWPWRSRIKTRIATKYDYPGLDDLECI